MSAPESPAILMIDDQPSVLLAMDTALRMAGFSRIDTCGDSREVEGLVAESRPDIVLLDLMMPGVGGESLLSFFNAEHPGLPVIVVTGKVDVDTAVRCMKAGAFDYLVKPVEDERLITAVQRAAAFVDLRRENEALRRQVAGERTPRAAAFAGIVTEDPQMLALFRYVAAIAETAQPVLIRGETGAGKELVARALHEASGRTGEFVVVNAGGLDDNVFSDTLFGHVRGAFTGADRDRAGLIEQAAGGTLFLDEIGDLSPASQVKLLRLLQEGEYMPLGLDEARRSNARIVASTNVSLRTLERAGGFRKDLAYRLRAHQVYLPPLRERPGDLPLLLDHFLEKAAAALNKPKPVLPPQLLPLLRAHPFPGNVRELESAVFDALSRHGSGPLSLDSFRERFRREREGELRKDAQPHERGLLFPETLPSLKEAADLLVTEALRRTGGNQTAAASLLGVSQQALSKRLRKEK